MVVIIPPENGITATLLDADWRKPSASNPSGSCVELGRLPAGSVAMRKSRDPSGPALVFSRAEIAAFFAGVWSGDFDELLVP
jgi:hypothetical protein